MNIIILGAGQVGSSVAEKLVSEANDITLIDLNADRLTAIREQFEIRSICGDGATPHVLKEAGAEDADLLIAVTELDHTNLCACKIAKILFNIPICIARIRSRDYIGHPDLFKDENFAVDECICPEQLITEYIQRLITYPEALQIISFAQGYVSLVCVRSYEGSELLNKPLKEIAPTFHELQMRIVAIYRNGEAIIPTGESVLLAGDEIFFITLSSKIKETIYQIRRSDKVIENVLIVGAGNIGTRLAAAIEHTCNVKIIEIDQKMASRAALQLDNSLVLKGNATNEQLLESENIDEVDLFISVTNNDEDNIMSAALAKRLGARKTMALVNRTSYAELMQGGSIDIALSPALISIGPLLSYARKGDVESVYSLRRGAAEAIEIIAHGDKKTSAVIGKRVDQLLLPKNAIVGAIVRYAKKEDSHELSCKMILPDDKFIFESEDHVIIFCASKKGVAKIEKLFQVGFAFL